MNQSWSSQGVALRLERLLTMNLTMKEVVVPPCKRRIGTGIVIEGSTPRCDHLGAQPLKKSRVFRAGKI
jgi:hypothetical protein